MNSGDKALRSMIEEAERLGREQESIEERNRKRRAKGRKPLPDPQEAKDLEVRRMRPRTGGPITVDGADAMRLFEIRKAAMSGSDPDIEDEGEGGSEKEVDLLKNGIVTYPSDKFNEEENSAQREAAAVRHVQDMKAGRIDHDTNWSPEGQKLEGGDDTSLPSSKQVWGKSDEQQKEENDNAISETENKRQSRKSKNTARGLMPAAAGLNEFKEDLYKRLKVSFEALETTLSDLQGRVSEIVTATTPSEKAEEVGAGESEFKELLSRKVPVVFDVGGTKMTFDAITVFHAPPCITVVSRSDSATIMPKPGANLNLTYEMDGKKYDSDPVTFLGTRFSLPMFGLSFVGFIRDLESDMMDVEQH